MNDPGAEYAYDALGLGRRITKVVGSDTTRYVHAGPQAIEEWDGTGSGANLRRLFVFGERIDQIVAMEAPDQADVDGDSNTTEVLRFSFHTQLIGSVTQVTGPAGTVVESYEYDPYGKPTIKDQGGSTVSASAIGNSYLFTARQLDEETGLYYYRARHYSPEMRRFIQRDPLEYVDGPNAVGYARSQPVMRTDPIGTETMEYSVHKVQVETAWGTVHIEVDQRLYEDPTIAAMAAGGVVGSMELKFVTEVVYYSESSSQVPDTRGCANFDALRARKLRFPGKWRASVFGLYRLRLASSHNMEVRVLLPQHSARARQLWDSPLGRDMVLFAEGVQSHEWLHFYRGVLEFDRRRDRETGGIEFSAWGSAEGLDTEEEALRAARARHDARKSGTETALSAAIGGAGMDEPIWFYDVPEVDESGVRVRMRSKFREHKMK